MYKKFISREFGNLHLKGFEYFCRACEIYAEEKLPITKSYHIIAKEFGVTYQAVERDIRTYVDRIKSGGTWRLATRVLKFTPKYVIPTIVFEINQKGEVKKDG